MSARTRMTGIMVALVVALWAGAVSAQQVELTLKMPSQMFWPGMPFWLHLDIQNSGPQLDSVQLYVAMDFGIGEYWFYPSWSHYPPAIDWLETEAPQAGEEREIIPEFPWPAGAGAGSVQFIAVLLMDGELVSNVAVISFSWSDDFVRIPAGSFMMGSPPTEMCRWPEETQHSVNLSHAFYMQRTEVTQTQWVDIFGVNPSAFIGNLQRPVELVTWYDCAIYCNHLSVAQGLRPAYYSDSSFATVFDGIPPVIIGPVFWDQSAPGYRLPTESEWEYACRAGTTTPYNNGQINTSCIDDPILYPLAWYRSTSNTGNDYETHVVGLKQANAYGLYDMHGNLHEWCWDWHGPYPAGSVTDPTGPDTGEYPVSRGGCWSNDANGCRSAIRGSGYPGRQRADLGFRPVLNAP
jgi:formylglycine-generating enzyme required for sulfatase activity